MVPQSAPRTLAAVCSSRSCANSSSRTDGSSWRHSAVGCTPLLARCSSAKPSSFSSVATLRLMPETVNPISSAAARRLPWSIAFNKICQRSVSILYLLLPYLQFCKNCVTFSSIIRQNAGFVKSRRTEIKKASPRLRGRYPAEPGLGVHHSFIFRSCLRFMRSSRAAFCLSHLASYSGVAGSMQRAKLQCRPSRRLSLKRRYQCPQ